MLVGYKKMKTRNRAQRLNERQRTKRGIPTGLRGMCRELLVLPGQPRETEKGSGVVLGVNFTGFHAMFPDDAITCGK
jgi:hypothetical protein